MKRLQRLGIATVFTVVFTSATLAGEISTPGIVQPSPTPAPSSAIAAGEIPINGGSSTSEDVSGTSLTDVAVDLLQLMLSVF